jgi:hypothetical protein
VRRQVRQYGEFPTNDAKRLGVAKALHASREPVLSGERLDLVDDVLDVALFLGKEALLCQLQILLESPGVLYSL